MKSDQLRQTTQSLITSSASSVSTRCCDDNRAMKISPLVLMTLVTRALHPLSLVEEKLMAGQKTSHESGKMYEDRQG